MKVGNIVKWVDDKYPFVGIVLDTLDYGPPTLCLLV